MPQIIPNIHPFLVHFTVALISVALLALILSAITVRWKELSQELSIVFRWSLWLCAIFSIATIVAGFYAYYSVEHNDVSHAVMKTHRNWALAAFVVIEIMAIWLAIQLIKKRQIRILFCIGVFIAFSLVSISGWYGAELVFRYGAGVISRSQENKSIIAPPKNGETESAHKH